MFSKQMVGNWRMEAARNIKVVVVDATGLEEFNLIPRDEVGGHVLIDAPDDASYEVIMTVSITVVPLDKDENEPAIEPPTSVRQPRSG